MKILFWEIKRYFRPVILVISAVLVLFWYIVFLRSANERFGNDYHGQLYALTAEYHDRFGDTIDAAEREEIERDFAAVNAEIDALYEQYFSEYGIHGTDDYEMLEDAAVNPEYEGYVAAAERWGADNIGPLYERCRQTVGENETFNRLEYRRRCIYRVISYFGILDEAKETFYAAVSASDAFDILGHEDTLLKNDFDKGEASLLLAVASGQDIFTKELYHNWSILIFTLCALIVTPMLISSRITGVQAMQFASRSGRPILRRQLAAALIVTVLVNIAADAFFWGSYFYSEYNPRFLLNCPLNAGSMAEMLWLNLTYRQFVLLHFAKVLIISLLLTCVIFAASYFCKNYIVGAAAVVVPTAAFTVWSQKLNSYLSMFYSHRIPLWIMIILPLAAVTASVVFLFRRVRQDYLY